MATIYATSGAPLTLTAAGGQTAVDRVDPNTGKTILGRPFTLRGPGVTRYTLTPEQTTAYAAAKTDEARRAILGKARTFVVTSGKVSVTTTALSAWRARIDAEITAADIAATPEKDASGKVLSDEARRAMAARARLLAELSAGTVTFPETDGADDTADAVASIFPV